MHLFKSNKFEPLTLIPGLNNSPSAYSDSGNNSYKKIIQIVANSSENESKLGAWYAAKCITALAGGCTNQIRNIYAVYFPLNDTERPIIGSNIRAGALCPPFCLNGNDSN